MGPQKLKRLLQECKFYLDLFILIGDYKKSTAKEESIVVNKIIGGLLCQSVIPEEVFKF